MLEKEVTNIKQGKARMNLVVFKRYQYELMVFSIYRGMYNNSNEKRCVCVCVKPIY